MPNQAYGGSKIWECKIGFAGQLPPHADLPMRRAIERAYTELTGQPPHFLFSGWGAELSKDEIEVLDRSATADKSSNSG